MLGELTPCYHGSSEQCILKWMEQNTHATVFFRSLPPSHSFLFIHLLNSLKDS